MVWTKRGQVHFHKIWLIRLKFSEKTGFTHGRTADARVTTQDPV